MSEEMGPREDLAFLRHGSNPILPQTDPPQHTSFYCLKSSFPFEVWKRPSPITASKRTNWLQKEKQTLQEKKKAIRLHLKQVAKANRTSNKTDRDQHQEPLDVMHRENPPVLQYSCPRNTEFNHNKMSETT